MSACPVVPFGLFLMFFWKVLPQKRAPLAVLLRNHTSYAVPRKLFSEALASSPCTSSDAISRRPQATSMRLSFSALPAKFRNVCDFMAAFWCLQWPLWLWAKPGQTDLKSRFSALELMNFFAIGHQAVPFGDLKGVCIRAYAGCFFLGFLDFWWFSCIWKKAADVSVLCVMDALEKPFSRISSSLSFSRFLGVDEIHAAAIPESKTSNSIDISSNMYRKNFHLTCLFTLFFHVFPAVALQAPTGEFSWIFTKIARFH